MAAPRGVEFGRGDGGVLVVWRLVGGLVKRQHQSFPSFSYGFNPRYPLQFQLLIKTSKNSGCGANLEPCGSTNNPIPWQTEYSK